IELMDLTYNGYSERRSEFKQQHSLENQLPVVPSPALVPEEPKRPHRDIIVSPAPGKPGTFLAHHEGTLLVESHQPLLDGARRLLAMGADPDEELRMYHRDGSEPALTAPIGVAATLTIEEGNNRPYFRRWKPFLSPDGSPKTGGNLSPVEDT